MTEKRLLMNACFLFQFSYYPLVWMFRSRAPNNRLNGLYKKALVYNEYTTSSFTELLAKDKSVTIHQRCILQTLAYEYLK